MQMNQSRLVLLQCVKIQVKIRLDVNENDLRAYQVKVKTEKEPIKRGYSRVQERVYNLRQRFSEAVTTGRRSGCGQITIDYHDKLVKIWDGSPASEPLGYEVAPNVSPLL